LIIGVGLWLIVLLRVLTHRRSKSSSGLRDRPLTADNDEYESSMLWLPQMPQILLFGALLYCLFWLVSSIAVDLSSVKFRSTLTLTAFVAASFLAAVVITVTSLNAFS